MRREGTPLYSVVVVDDDCKQAYFILAYFRCVIVIIIMYIYHQDFTWKGKIMGPVSYFRN